MLQGVGTKDNVLIEIFASRSPEQIRALNDVYLEGIDDDLNDINDWNVENIVFIYKMYNVWQLPTYKCIMIFLIFNFVIDCDHEFILDVFPPKKQRRSWP